ncbi:MAG TPA: phage holin family protein [Kineosporiaceae bacterium]|nr:phage holin family protein [Kineosporiaceae bacterium]
MTEQQTVGAGNGTGAERTLGQLVADASRDLSQIVRAEVALARAELSQDMRHGAMAGGMFGFAGYLVLLATVTGLITVAYALTGTGLPAWAAFGIVTLALLLLAGLLALVGRSRIGRIGPPERALRSSRRTIEAVRPGSGGR